MKKRDYIMLGSIVLFVIVCLCLFTFFNKKGNVAYVYHKGELIKTIELKTNQEIDILDGRMVLIVKDGKIGVKKTDCADLTCVHMGMVDSSSRPIICAPNGIYICIGQANKDVIIG